MNDKKYKGANGMVVMVVLLVIVLVFWLMSRMQAAQGDMTYDQFQKEVKNKNVSEVVIDQNQAVPTGSVTMRLTDSNTQGTVYVSDVKEVQDFLEEQDVEYKLTDVSEDSICLLYTSRCV